MKTLTEFPGIPMREIYRWCAELMAEARKGPRPKAPPKPTEPAETVAPVDETPVAVESPPAEDPPVEAAPPEPPAEEKDPRIKSPEERMAEFEKRKAEESRRRHERYLELIEAIKEPLSARIKEKYQWSDERIAQVFPSIDLIRKEQLERLRRIVLWKSDKEGEPLPKQGIKLGDLIYVVEYLPGPERPREERPRRGRGDRKGPRGKGRGPRREGGEGFRADGDRPPRGPRPPRDGQRRGPGGPPSGPRPGGRRPPRPRVEIKKTPSGVVG